MGSEIQYGASCINQDNPSNSPIWNNVSNANGVQNGTNASCTIDFSSGDIKTDYLRTTINNFTISGKTITSVQGQLYMRNSGFGSTPNGTNYIYFSVTGDSGFCPGHTLNWNTTAQWRSVTCVHIAWTTTNIDNATIRIYTSRNSGDLLNTYIDSFRMVVNWADPPQAPTWDAIPFDVITTNSLKPDWVAPVGGDAPTGYDLQWDNDPSFPTPPTQTIDVGNVTTYLHSSLNPGTRYYYRVRGYNDGGDGTWSTTESKYTLCTTPTISSAVGGASKITINWTTVTGVNTWDLQRSSNGSTGWATVEAGMSAGTLSKIDTVPKAGETWYYRLRANNSDGNPSAWSANANGTATGLSIFSPSALRVNATQQTFLSTNLTVILRQEVFVPTTLRVNVTQQIFSPSTLKVRVVGQQIFLPSSLVVKTTQSTLLSTTLRVLVFTASFTPEVTFSRYEFNDVSSGTIDDNLNFGLWEGYKTLNAVRVDPYEATMVNPDKHEFYYSVSPRSGSENFFQNPVSNALINSSGVAENGYRAIGFDQQVWSSGTTELISLIDTDGDWAGSGARVNLTGSWSNSGTSWSPPSASGTNVFDVPRPYNGTMMVVVQPTDWDGDTDHKLHDWLPFQVSVGHAVEVSGFSFISGTHEDSTINAQGNLNTDYDISFRVYHEMAKEWEWYSGATKVRSGSITPVKNTWKFINNLVMSGVASSTVYSLYLFAASGTVLHPNPVRVITVNMII